MQLKQVPAKRIAVADKRNQFQRTGSNKNLNLHFFVYYLQAMQDEMR